MAQRNYRTVSLPNTLLDRIDSLIGEHPRLGYTNRSEFIKEAIRRLLDELEDD